MPINYLNLQPQITEYCQKAMVDFQKYPEIIASAINLLHRFSKELQQGLHSDLSMLSSDSPTNRCSRPSDEIIDSTFTGDNSEEYNLLASDGSQISSNHHDALPISLINTSTVFFQPNSGAAPKINTQSEFIRDQSGNISTRIVEESLVNTSRDVRELQALANYSYTDKKPLVSLSDGPLELFQEPRSGSKHKTLFTQYQEALYATCKNNQIMAGYIDKPRANLIVKMLELIYKSDVITDIQSITDANIFSQLLPPGSRSAIFLLNAPSSKSYMDSITLHFFYLNVGSEQQPWIVRVEITQCIASVKDKVTLLQQALLDQCKLMGNRPYPYILHRAHEEAVVRFDEREAITEMLSRGLRAQGVEIDSKSNKLNAKELEQRTRLI